MSVQNHSQTLASRANQTVSAVDGGVQSAEMGQSAMDSLRDSVEEIAIVVAEIHSSVTTSASEAEQLATAFGGRRNSRRLESVSRRFGTW